MTKYVISLWLALAAGTAWADAPCLMSGDTVTLSGIVAERRVDADGDGRDTRTYLFRTAAPVCIAGADDAPKSKTDKLQLVAADAQSRLLGALARVSGGKVRIHGTLSTGNPRDEYLVPNVIRVAEAYDLESGAEAVLLEPEIPVRIRFRKALLSSGDVASFKNETDQQLAVTLDIFRPSTGRQYNKDLVLNASETKEIGEREGWAFVEGDRIQLSRKGYQTLTVLSP